MQADPFKTLDDVIASMPRTLNKLLYRPDQIRRAMELAGCEEEQIMACLRELDVSEGRSGRNSAFCRELGIHPPATYAWRKKGKIPPGQIDKIVAIAIRNGLNITREDLLP